MTHEIKDKAPSSILDRRAACLNAIYLAFFASISIKVFYIFVQTYGYLTGHGNESIPLTFHTIWEILFIIFMSSKVKDLGVENSQLFFIKAFVCAGISTFFWSLTPFSYFILEPRYSVVGDKIISMSPENYWAGFFSGRQLLLRITIHPRYLSTEVEGVFYHT